MDRVLIAVDGAEQAGPATAYLIERVHGGCALEFVVITVEAPPVRRTHPPVHRSPSQLQSGVSRKKRNPRPSVEGARPWLDDAGVRYQFIWETGDLSQVINRLASEQDFSEVVVVSPQATASSRILGPLMGRSSASDLRQLQTRWRTRRSVVTADRLTGRRS